MKAILVLFDTLNRRMLPPYGCDWVHAPNFQRLAERTVTFDNVYVGSMPCMPARRELHTGRYNFLHRSWGPIEPFDDSTPEMLKNNGVYSHLITDHGHYFADGGATYHTRYSSWELNRGQEGDPWKAHIDPSFAIPPTAREHESNQPSTMWKQEHINRQYMPTADDQPQAHTFRQGVEFLKNNHTADNWFLQIETFDPHEPFFTHPEYKDLYPHEYEGSIRDWPSYGEVTESPETVQHIRNQYAALVSMCDDSLGKVLDTMDRYDLWQDTMLIVTTDHGLLLGEHDSWGKNVRPWYNENANIPMFIWDPRSRIRHERRQSLVQLIDIPATLLEYFGVARPPDMQGVPLRDTVAYDAAVRDASLFGAFGGHVNVTDGRYVYMRAPQPDANEPLYEYTLMPTHIRSHFTVEELQTVRLHEPFSFTKDCPVMQIEGQPWGTPDPFETLLYDVVSDPHQQHPLQDKQIEEQMIRHLLRLLDATDAPAEQFARLGLERVHVKA